MKKFIKENWFKLSILTVITLFFVALAFKNLRNGFQKDISLENQEKCSKKSKEMFFDHTSDYERNYGVYTFANHYNNELGRCFILITGGDTSVEYHSTLYDSYENKELGGVHTAVDVAGLCGLEIDGKYNTCGHIMTQGYAVEAIREFKELTKTYMEN